MTVKSQLLEKIKAIKELKPSEVSSEQATKQTIILPLLKRLGWDD